jgi:hypothetical protein
MSPRRIRVCDGFHLARRLKSVRNQRPTVTFHKPVEHRHSRCIGNRCPLRFLTCGCRSLLPPVASVLDGSDLATCQFKLGVANLDYTVPRLASI